MDGADGLIIAIDGEGVTPTTVDGRALLRLAERYIAALESACREAGLTLTYEPGLSVVSKCGGILMPGRVEMFREASLAMFASRQRNPNKGVYKNLDREIELLPPGHHAVVQAGEWSAHIKCPLDEQYSYNERVERDVFVRGVHASSKLCSVEVTDRATGQQFTLHCDREVSIRASTCYTRDAVITADVDIQLDTHKMIGGRLIAIEPINATWNVGDVVEWMKSEFDPRKLDS